jgi:large subunit ribosomal protein L23
MNIRNIVKKSILTEKATIFKEKNNEYVFVVDRCANKFQIRQAIELLFKVKVKNIRTLNYLGKNRKVGGHAGFKNNWKKAVIRLVSGQEIKIIDDV